MDYIDYTGRVLKLVNQTQTLPVGTIVYCFLEFTRNVPVLLHILFIHGLVVIHLPVPKRAVDFADSFFLTNRGVFVPKPIWEPGAWVVAAAFLSSIALAIIFRRWAKKKPR